MNLHQALLLSGTDLPHSGTPAGFRGKKYRVIDYPGYGDEISEHDDKKEAEHAADARPYAKVIQAFIQKEGSRHCVKSHKGKNLGCYPSKGAAAKRLRQIEYYKHVDGVGAAPTEKSSLYPVHDELDTPKVRDIIRRRRVRTNPNVD